VASMTKTSNESRCVSVSRTWAHRTLSLEYHLVVQQHTSILIPRTTQSGARSNKLRHITGYFFGGQEDFPANVSRAYPSSRCGYVGWGLCSVLVIISMVRCCIRKRSQMREANLEQCHTRDLGGRDATVTLYVMFHGATVVYLSSVCRSVTTQCGRLPNLQCMANATCRLYWTCYSCICLHYGYDSVGLYQYLGPLVRLRT
jgi:hypothetical protein